MIVKKTRELDRRLNELLKQWINPVLKQAGFKKKNLSYVADRGSLSWYLNVQRSQWNSQEKLEFTVNCGVFVPGVVSTWTNHPPKKSVTLTKCAIYVRLGMLTEERRDRWWVLEERDDADSVDRAIGEELQNTIQEYGLGFLRDFNTPVEVAEFLVASPESAKYVDPMSRAYRLAYAAIVYYLMGNRERKTELIDEAVKMVTGSSIDGVESHMLNLRKRLGEDG